MKIVRRFQSLPLADALKIELVFPIFLCSQFVCMKYDLLSVFLSAVHKSIVSICNSFSKFTAWLLARLLAETIF